MAPAQPTLDATPSWARRRMFGHRSPAVVLTRIGGGVVDQSQLVGTSRLMVYWDRGDRVEEAAAVDFMQVLQKAQADLANEGCVVMFVHVRYPTGTKEPMNDEELVAWHDKWSVIEDGNKLAPLPLFRVLPDAPLGSDTVHASLGSSPTIVILDESGLVRWHSEGVHDPEMIGSPVTDPEQATIISAIEFALELKGPRAPR